MSSCSEPDPEISEILTTSAELDSDECCAENAIDKDLSTVASTSTEDGYGMLKINFSKTYFIQKIVIYYRFYTNWFDQTGLWCAFSADNFRTCVNVNSDIDVSVYQGEVQQKSCGTLKLTYGLEQSDQIYTLLCNVAADNMRFTKTSPNHIILAEVIAIGSEMGKLT